MENEPQNDSSDTPIDPLAAGIVDMDESDGDPDEGLDPEFTLATLSQAYAGLAGEKQAGDDVSDELTPESDSPTTNEASTNSTDLDQSKQSPGAQESKDSTDDDAACPVSPESIIESMLFVGCPSDVKLTGKKIAAVLRDVSPKEVGQIVKKLNAGYEQEQAAFRIEAKRGVYRMVLDQSLEAFQNDYFGRNREAKLAQSAIDVLAVVAYHQPATREEVDKIRGKQSGSVLSQLVKRELLVVEKTDEKPTQKIYSTTDRFLDLFGLAGIDELPQSHEMADIEELAD